MSLQRNVISVMGKDATSFLQNLITNDITNVAPDHLVYAALLSPQGKYLADFFVLAVDGGFILDVAAQVAPVLGQRLTMYKLRSDVQIAESPLRVATGSKGLADPRHPALPRRNYGDVEDAPDPLALRVAHVIPQSGIELHSDSYILESGFERLNGVDFRKGCYVGQEVTARMKHKTELKKGLVSLAIQGEAPIGTPILNGSKVCGTLFSQYGERALAHMRFDRMTGEMQAGGASLSRL